MNSDDEFICYWCRLPGHLKRHCGLYRDWKNLRIQQGNDNVSSNDYYDGHVRVHTEKTKDIRIKVDMQTSKIPKFWARVPSDQELSVVEFLSQMSSKVNCEFDKRTVLTIDGFEILDNEMVSILRDGDVVKCSIPSEKWPKLSNSTGTQCKIVTRYHSRGVQCTTKPEQNDHVSPVKRNNRHKGMKKPKSSSNHGSIAASSSGYRTRQTGELMSDMSSMNRRAQDSDKVTFRRTFTSDDDLSSHYSEMSDVEYDSYDSEWEKISQRIERKYGTSGVDHSNQVKREIRTIKDHVKYDHQSAGVPSAVPKNLWPYYAKMGWNY